MVARVGGKKVGDVSEKIPGKTPSDDATLKLAMMNGKGALGLA